jgi:hypothetical protein
MSKRSRRTTLCQVEQLEGRAALSTVVYSAVVIGTSPKVVDLRGYTTRVVPGEHLLIKAFQQRTHPSTKIDAYTVAEVQKPIDRKVPDQSGSFFGSIRAEHPWHVGGELKVEVFFINPPESLPSLHLLATEHIRIQRD